ncbi:MAG: hypothetical protein WCL14_13210 [Bacteroidota bacterium]
MNAIRKIIQREGNELRIVLPDDFKSEKFEVIVLPSDEEIENKKDLDIEAYRQAIRDRWSKFSVDMSNFKFNRDELYER